MILMATIYREVIHGRPANGWAHATAILLDIGILYWFVATVTWQIGSLWR